MTKYQRAMSWRDKNMACAHLALRLGLTTIFDGGGITFMADVNSRFHFPYVDTALYTLTIIDQLYDSTTRDTPERTQAHTWARDAFRAVNMDTAVAFTHMLDNTPVVRRANIEERRRLEAIGGKFIPNPARD